VSMIRICVIFVCICVRWQKWLSSDGIVLLLLNEGRLILFLNVKKQIDMHWSCG